jgi:hypothetical protein
LQQWPIKPLTENGRNASVNTFRNKRMNECSLCEGTFSVDDVSCADESSDLLDLSELPWRPPRIYSSDRGHKTATDKKGNEYTCYKNLLHKSMTAG